MPLTLVEQIKKLREALEIVRWADTWRQATFFRRGEADRAQISPVARDVVAYVAQQYVQAHQREILDQAAQLIEAAVAILTSDDDTSDEEEE